MSKKHFYAGFGIALSMVGFLGLLYVASPFIYAASGGVINISAIVRGVSTPTNNTDAATKAYVDASYVGPSSWTCAVRSISYFSPDSFSTVTASCAGSEKLITGGCSATVGGSNSGISASYPASNGWTCSSIDGVKTVTAYAWCCQ